ncbi:claudin-16-like [Dromiciops gliroides]|uniref:claudin-16-like n=1 Tax=Dromiciops gliroides TaxID=33562 RepID=UPI001CC40DA2|nr:claudin-16-like [Dromiciops gliroides]
MPGPSLLPLASLALLSTALLLTATWTDCWVVNSDDSLEVSHKCQGLWRACVTNLLDGIRTCDQYDSILATHPRRRVLTRSLLLVAGLLCSCGLVALLLTLTQAQFLGSDPRTRIRLAWAAGCLLGAGGFPGALGSLWFAVEVALERTLPTQPRGPLTGYYEWGWSCWLGIVGSAGCMATASSLACCLPGLWLPGRRSPGHQIRSRLHPQGIYILDSSV